MYGMTWLTLRTKIETELDMLEEVFVTPQELIDYGNDAIDAAAKEILTIYQDYFKKSYILPVVTGTQKLQLPADVYAHKMRLLQYKNGTLIYKVRRIAMRNIVNVKAADDYMFDVEQNTSASVTDNCGLQLVLWPSPRETDAVNGADTNTPKQGTVGYFTLWYLREPVHIVDDTTIIDCPEAHTFIEKAIKCKIYRKELHPLLQDALGELEAERVSLRMALDVMIPDEDEVLEPDVSFYDDFNLSDY